MFSKQTVLVTGGTGSFGRKFCQMVLDSFPDINKILVYSRDELKQLEMAEQFKHNQRLQFVLGDVRDVDRLSRVLDGVDYVVHAAALKQVPSAEYNPSETIKTNIIGAANIIDASIDRGVKKVIALSTDKACNPINLYGATKLCADKLFVAANSYAITSARPTRFALVRYGNVIGSRGSVIPIFLKARDTGILTVTDPGMTRFWITLESGVRFVLACLSQMWGGEIFVPKIPSMNIMDLVQALAPECNIKYSGIRPGEKLHESMISLDDARNTLEYEGYYVIQPDLSWWDKVRYQQETGGQLVASDFTYSSCNNPHILSTEELRHLVPITRFETR